MIVMTLHLPSGGVVLAHAIAMHRRIPGRQRPYARATHWLAMTGSGQNSAWGRTRREAFANLKTTLGIRNEEEASK
jgi:hypothetical protein